MSTETPDAEAAWETYAYDPETKELRPAIVYREKVAFMAGRESLSARLDALREQLDANCSSDVQATLDRLHAENQRLRDDLHIACVAARANGKDTIAARAERDALRDAITALADEWARDGKSSEWLAAHESLVAAVIVAAGWRRMHNLDGVLRELNIHIEEGTA